MDTPKTTTIQWMVHFVIIRLRDEKSSSVIRLLKALFWVDDDMLGQRRQGNEDEKFLLLWTASIYGIIGSSQGYAILSTSLSPFIKPHWTDVMVHCSWFFERTFKRVSKKGILRDTNSYANLFSRLNGFNTDKGGHKNKIECQEGSSKISEPTAEGTLLHTIISLTIKLVKLAVVPSFYSKSIEQ